LRPLKIAAHAFSQNTPFNDLYISVYHSIVIGGALVRIGHLYNGITITHVNKSCDIEYFHLEFDKFGFVYANGMPCETFHNIGNRNDFDNSQEYWNLYTDTPGTPKAEDTYYLASGSIEYVYNVLVDRAAKLHRAVAHPLSL
jgi:hypothetical protein